MVVSVACCGAARVGGGVVSRFLALLECRFGLSPVPEAASMMAVRQPTQVAIFGYPVCFGDHQGEAT